MKTFVHFDARGTIHSVINLDAPEEVMAMLELEPGKLVAEIDAPQLTGPSEDIEKMQELARQYKVATPSIPRYKLTKSS
jgi:hypothetical protein